MKRERSERKSSGEELEQKRLAKPFSVKSVDDAGTLDGHGIVFDDPHPTSSWALGDGWNDVVRPGSFKRALSEHKRRGTTPLMLYMHERGNVVGAWRDIAEDSDGLAVKGQIATTAKAPSGAGIYELLKMGALTGLSIGFRVKKQALDQDKKLREIFDVDLEEISIVDMPGNPSARITDVKSKDLRSPQFLEQVLRDAGLSRKEAKALLAEGLPALRDVVAEPLIGLRDAGQGGAGGSDFASLIRGFAQSIKP